MKKLMILGFALLLFSSCKDYLQEDVKSFKISDDYYKTKAGYIALVNAGYSSLRDIYKMDPYIFEAGTDMTIRGRQIQPYGLSEYKELSPVEVDPSFPAYIKTFYYNCFASINILNCGLYYNNPVTTITDAELKKYEGQLRFLRAFDYFILVQQFGGVPIILQYSKEPDMSYDRNTAEEVYNFIIDEMKAARLLVVDDQAAGKNPTGRVTIRTIKHFLSKVYLTRGYESFAKSDDFGNAALYADSAISGQRLTISFEDLFFPGKEINSEILFAVQYDAASIVNPYSDGNRQNAFFGPYLGGEGTLYGYPARTYALCPTMYAYDLFTENDARFDATFMVFAYGSYNTAKKYIGRYYDYYDKATDRKSLKIAYFFPHKWVTDDSISKVMADPRWQSNSKVYKYGIAWEPVPNSADFSTPIVKKFDDPKSQYTSTGGILGGSSTRDIYLARLGETYLIAAEAYFKLGDPATAANRINEVRSRAAKPGKSLAITADSVDLNYILDERGRELLGEYHRWFDLKRTGTLKERTRLYNREIKAHFDSGVDPFAGASGVDKILRPIPQAEIDANRSKNFPQNPAYQ